MSRNYDWSTFSLVAHRVIETDNCYLRIIATKQMSRQLSSAPAVRENIDELRELFPIRNESLSLDDKESVYQVLAHHDAVISRSKADLEGPSCRTLY